MVEPVPAVPCNIAHGALGVRLGTLLDVCGFVAPIEFETVATQYKYLLLAEVRNGAVRDKLGPLPIALVKEGDQLLVSKNHENETSYPEAFVTEHDAIDPGTQPPEVVILAEKLYELGIVGRVNSVEAELGPASEYAVTVQVNFAPPSVDFTT